MDFAFYLDLFPKIIKGLPLTLNLGVLSLLGGGLLALFLNAIRVTRLGAAIASSYVWALRGAPLLILMFLIYYGLASFPFIRQSIFWPFLREPYWCGLLALILCDAAYTSEILRGGLKSVPQGVIEAGRAAGMSRFTIFRRITLPLAFRQALPAYSNEVISMFKSTALVSTITLMDITGIAREQVSVSWRAVEIFISAGLIYLAISLAITWGAAIIERRLSPWAFGGQK